MGRTIRIRGAALAAVLGASTVVAGVPPAPTAPGAGAQVGAQRWSVEVPGGRFHWSSPVIADVDGDASADVVVGGLNGRLYAYDASGRALPGWTGGVAATAAVASSPAVGDLDGDGRMEVAVGVGSIEVTGQRGALDVFDHDGSRRCSVPTRDPRLSQGTAVFAAPAIGDVNGDGRSDVVYGSFDHRIRVVDGGNCSVLGEFESKDSVWSAPALHDNDGNGTAEIYIGVDASRNPQTGESLDGGYFRALHWSPGYTHPDGHRNLRQHWQRSSTETFQSAAAVGDVNGDGRLEVVTGSGGYWCRHFGQCADSAKVWAFHLDDGSDVAGWPRTASYETTFLSAPALGDVDGDGSTDVVIGTNRYDQSQATRPPNGGAVDVFHGAPGKPRATFVSPDVEVVASPVIADVTGSGPPEVLVGTASQVYALGPDLGVVQAGIATSPAVNRKSAAAVGQLGPSWAVVSAGFDDAGNGWLQVHDIPDPGSEPRSSAPWPMHRRDARRTGVLPPPPPRSGFVDVRDSSPYADAVVWAVGEGITGGCATDPARFCPTAAVTRAQAATFLWRAAGQPAGSGPQFADVRAGAYYAEAVRWVRDEGITSGCTATRFCPDGSATRAQLVTFLWRAAGEPEAEGGHRFSDVPDGAYYEEAVVWAVREGITTGTTTTAFSPNLAVTRGQTVVLVHRDAS